MTKPTPETLEAYRRDVAVWDGYKRYGAQCEPGFGPIGVYRKVIGLGERWTGTERDLPNYPADLNVLLPCLMKLKIGEFATFIAHIGAILAGPDCVYESITFRNFLAAEPWQILVALWKTVCEKGKV